MANNEQFDKVCSAIEIALGDDYTARIDYDAARTPLAIYHATLDGKECLISVLFTDVTGSEPKK